MDIRPGGPIKLETVQLQTDRQTDRQTRKVQCSLVVVKLHTSRSLSCPSHLQPSL